jgi:protein-L-isoaspartate(D-aspartate) O-methyltransferase
MKDMGNTEQLRYRLVEQLRNKGIRDEAVLEAIANVPRHLFLGMEVSGEEAYEDKPLAIGQGQTISQPYTVAYQTSLLRTGKGEKVLEIGTGSGYQSAILAELGVELYSIERQKKLFLSTRRTLDRLGYPQVKMIFGDGNEGLEEAAPFDKILVTAAAPEIPGKLIAQLKVNGMMVIPVNGNLQKMLRITKLSATETRIEQFDHFLFVPLLTGVAEK